ncbi:MAG: hypothetical protein V3U54_08675 [Thermodesulfobacteriota bacterium]
MANIYKENYEMRKEIQKMSKAFSDIESIIYCIGGPLNDNVLRYNKKQLKTFWEISFISSEYGGGSNE